ncbi:asparaginase [Fulvivirga sp. 29W222]|uniref:asparaginase n=1 Tax=Fulvivirga marina TaxID=2494733 RepID=A0A937KD78_9BACT|nr:asparaginase [Fulvivirga marina]MBL6448322.1 asparaginase [Fulvivirga marina]
MNYSKINIITSAYSQPETSILIIYTGGTLGMVHDEKGALVPFDFSSILNHVPSLRRLELNLTVISFEEPIDSSNIGPDDWVKIGQIIFENYNDFHGFVVLHGTDTMAFTASALSFMLENLGKPVIFTGAQLPISSLRSDARENLITALEIASSKSGTQPLVPEVCIYFDYVLLRGNRSKKVQSLHFDAFESENYPVMAESGVVINYNTSAIYQIEDNKPLVLHSKFDRRVVILKLYPGITQEAVEAILHIEGLRGVVLETFGSGNAPTSEWFIGLVKEAVSKGIIILNVSQCPGGRVIQGRYDTSQQLNELGVIEGADLTLEAAITKLMMVLGEEDDVVEIKKRLIQPICGELTLN